MKPLFFIFAYLTGLSALANDVSENRNWYFIGSDFFYQKKQSTDLPEIDNSGFGLSGKLVYSRYSQSPWIADLGIGYRVDEMEDQNVEIETDAFYLEAGVRRVINEKWSIGPEIHFLVGQDVSFSDTGTNSDDKSTALFGGLRVMRDSLIYNKQNRFRLGAQYLVDINIDDRMVSSLQLVAEFGWPCKASQVASAPVKKATVRKEPKVSLNSQALGIQFASGSDELLGTSKTVIKNLGQVLMTFNSEWDLLRIEGHTDKTGDYEMNKNLSYRRAKSVLNELATAGVDTSKIEASGFGPDQPLEDREDQAAYMKNRRVEVHLESDNASKKFIDSLKALEKLQ